VINDKKKEVNQIQKWRNQLKKDSKSEDNSGKMPKSVDACSAKMKKL